MAVFPDELIIELEAPNDDIYKLGFTSEAGAFSCTISMGLTNWPADAGQKVDLIELTDQALYYSKRNGRNRVTAHQDLGNRLPELHLGRREDFIVLDASRCNLTNGPYPGEQADSNLIVASTDPIAVDATGVAVLKYWMAQRNINNNDIRGISVWDQPQIARALQIGIGISSPSEYSQQSQGVSEIDDILAMMA